MKSTFYGFVLVFLCNLAIAQEQQPWHGKERAIHYRPDGEDIVLVNGKRRFNRALYGGNTAFRVEAGDGPEFALYLPGMGGNLKLGIVNGNNSRWLTTATRIIARYRAGSMLYTIGDELLQGGSLSLTVLPLFDEEGVVVKISGEDLPKGLQMVSLFGGVTGQKFSRDGDIGADPESSFYLKPEYCTSNIIQTDRSSYKIHFGFKKEATPADRQALVAAGQAGTYKTLTGQFPGPVTTGDAQAQSDPLAALKAPASAQPLVRSSFVLEAARPVYILVRNGVKEVLSDEALAQLFQKSENTRKQLSSQVRLHTPDPYINTVGSALSMAADAIWETPSFMHGAVAWRMRLNGWRGAYAADVLGWPQRARQHFDAYLLSQVSTPEVGPVVMDTALNLARGQEKMGTDLFSKGYIARNPNGDFRPHHYDMNLVFMDQLLNHLQWTGDKTYMRKVWPALKSHLAWEKRNFDRDGDGLYDSYAAIWASDALQYSGGGVTHSSAYNYRSNLLAAQWARILGEDPAPYQGEADRILKAMKDQLWLKDKGWYAEYKDLLGKKLLHPSAGLWTVYHSIDSKANDPFQAYQMLQYVDRYIPHIPVKANGLTENGLYTLSTTNWQPYTWSLNNVALGELMHTALAYWQGGRSEEAFRLWKSTLVESMYLGASPGNFQQLSFYDAVRGELYRDFADGIGMTARSLVEGLFGLQPDLLKDSLYLQPGLPASWNFASLETPSYAFHFNRKGAQDEYRIQWKGSRRAALNFVLPAQKSAIDKITVNGKTASWQYVSQAIGLPKIWISAPAADSFKVSIVWKGAEISVPSLNDSLVKGSLIRLQSPSVKILKLYDPQEALTGSQITERTFTARSVASEGAKTFFLQLQQGSAIWWQPYTFEAQPSLQITMISPDSFQVNRLGGQCSINGVTVTIKNDTKGTSIPARLMLAGTNEIRYQIGKEEAVHHFIQWEKNNTADIRYEQVDLSQAFNDEVSQIFHNEYRSPRPKTITLQLPLQGIGNWAYPKVTAPINDSGLRKRAGALNSFTIQQGVPFATPGQVAAKNIAFTSQWDNYPDSITVPLRGKASHAYLLMAGSTNSMQSQVVNGLVKVLYTDGSSDLLELRNPQNWWPIEQDLDEDGFAFHTGAPKPVRVYLKTGEDSRSYSNFISIKGYANRAIDGGAATVLDLPLDKNKVLKSLVLSTEANDVVIGLMSLTLVR